MSDDKEKLTNHIVNKKVSDFFFEDVQPPLTGVERTNELLYDIRIGMAFIVVLLILILVF